MGAVGGEGKIHATITMFVDYTTSQSTSKCELANAIFQLSKTISIQLMKVCSKQSFASQRKTARSRLDESSSTI